MAMNRGRARCPDLSLVDAADALEAVELANAALTAPDPWRQSVEESMYVRGETRTARLRQGSGDNRRYPRQMDAEAARGRGVARGRGINPPTLETRTPVIRRGI